VCVCEDLGFGSVPLVEQAWQVVVVRSVSSSVQVGSLDRAGRHGTGAVSKYIRFLCTWVEEPGVYDRMIMAGVDSSNNAVLPLRRDNGRYAVAVTPSATINNACLIDDDQAEACNALSLLCVVVVDLMLSCYMSAYLSDMVVDGGLAWPGCLDRASHELPHRDISHHLVHEK
jgi:hypothetical protein